jgi:hypothetical protein
MHVRSMMVEKFKDAIQRCIENVGMLLERAKDV